MKALYSFRISRAKHLAKRFLDARAYPSKRESGSAVTMKVRELWLAWDVPVRAAVVAAGAPGLARKAIGSWMWPLTLARASMLLIPSSRKGCVRVDRLAWLDQCLLSGPPVDAVASMRSRSSSQAGYWTIVPVSSWGGFTTVCGLDATVSNWWVAWGWGAVPGELFPWPTGRPFRPFVRPLCWAMALSSSSNETGWAMCAARAGGEPLLMESFGSPFFRQNPRCYR